MKLFEFIMTYPNTKEVYKDYRYFKNTKECKKYLESFGMEVVRIQIANSVYDNDILKSAKEELENRE